MNTNENIVMSDKAKLLKSEECVSAPILDYYTKFGHNRDLEQYFTHSGSRAARESASTIYDTHCELAGGEDHSRCSTAAKIIQRGTGKNIVGNLSATKPKDVKPFPILKVKRPEDQSRKTPVGDSAILGARHISIKWDSRANITLQESDIRKNLSSPDAMTERGDESHQHLDSSFNKPSSPTSSVTSRKLEWDSLADVGYSNVGTSGTKLSTLERMALDSQLKYNEIIRSSNQPASKTGRVDNRSSSVFGFPEAHSTPILATSQSETAPARGAEKPRVLYRPARMYNRRISKRTPPKKTRTTAKAEKDAKVIPAKMSEPKIDAEGEEADKLQSFKDETVKPSSRDNPAGKLWEECLDSDLGLAHEILFPSNVTVEHDERSKESEGALHNMNSLSTCPPNVISIESDDGLMKNYKDLETRVIILQDDSPIAELPIDNSPKCNDSLFSQVESFEYMPGDVYQDTEYQRDDKSGSVPSSSQRRPSTGYDWVVKSNSSQSLDGHSALESYKDLRTPTSFGGDLDMGVDLTARLSSMPESLKDRLIKKVVKMLVTTQQTNQVGRRDNQQLVLSSSSESMPLKTSHIRKSSENIEKLNYLFRWPDLATDNRKNVQKSSTLELHPKVKAEETFRKVHSAPDSISVEADAPQCVTNITFREGHQASTGRVCEDTSNTVSYNTEQYLQESAAKMKSRCPKKTSEEREKQLTLQRETTKRYSRALSFKKLLENHLSKQHSGSKTSSCTDDTEHQLNLINEEISLLNGFKNKLESRRKLKKVIVIPVETECSDRNTVAESTSSNESENIITYNRKKAGKTDHNVYIPPLDLGKCSDESNPSSNADHSKLSNDKVLATSDENVKSDVDGKIAQAAFLESKESQKKNRNNDDNAKVNSARSHQRPSVEDDSSGLYDCGHNVGAGQDEKGSTGVEKSSATSSHSGVRLCPCCRSNIISSEPSTGLSNEKSTMLDTDKELQRYEQVFQRYERCKVIQNFMQEYDLLILKYQKLKAIQREAKVKDKPQTRVAQPQTSDDKKTLRNVKDKGSVMSSERYPVILESENNKPTQRVEDEQYKKPKIEMKDKKNKEIQDKQPVGVRSSLKDTGSLSAATHGDKVKFSEEKTYKTFRREEDDLSMKPPKEKPCLGDMKCKSGKRDENKLPNKQQLPEKVADPRRIRSSVQNDRRQKTPKSRRGCFSDMRCMPKRKVNDVPYQKYNPDNYREPNTIELTIHGADKMDSFEEASPRMDSVLLEIKSPDRTLTADSQHYISKAQAPDDRQRFVPQDVKQKHKSRCCSKAPKPVRGPLPRSDGSMSSDQMQKSAEQKQSSKCSRKKSADRSRSPQSDDNMSTEGKQKPKSKCFRKKSSDRSRSPQSDGLISSDDERKIEKQKSKCLRKKSSDRSRSSKSDVNVLSDEKKKSKSKCFRKKSSDRSISPQSDEKLKPKPKCLKKKSSDRSRLPQSDGLISSDDEHKVEKQKSKSKCFRKKSSDRSRSPQSDGLISSDDERKVAKQKSKCVRKKSSDRSKSPKSDVDVSSGEKQKPKSKCFKKKTSDRSRSPKSDMSSDGEQKETKQKQRSKCLRKKSSDCDKSPLSDGHMSSDDKQKPKSKCFPNKSSNRDKSPKSDVTVSSGEKQKPQLYADMSSEDLQQTPKSFAELSSNDLQQTKKSKSKCCTKTSSDRGKSPASDNSILSDYKQTERSEVAQLKQKKCCNKGRKSRSMSPKSDSLMLAEAAYGDVSKKRRRKCCIKASQKSEMARIASDGHSSDNTHKATLTSPKRKCCAKKTAKSDNAVSEDEAKQKKKCCAKPQSPKSDNVLSDDKSKQKKKCCAKKASQKPPKLVVESDGNKKTKRRFSGCFRRHRTASQPANKVDGPVAYDCGAPARDTAQVGREPSSTFSEPEVKTGCYSFTNKKHSKKDKRSAHQQYRKYNENKNVFQDEEYRQSKKSSCTCPQNPANLNEMNPSKCLHCRKMEKIQYISRIIDQQRKQSALPKPVAYNLIVEVSDDVFQEPTTVKRKHLSRVVVRVPSNVNHASRRQQHEDRLMLSDEFVSCRCDENLLNTNLSPRSRKHTSSCTRKSRKPKNKSSDVKKTQRGCLSCRKSSKNANLGKNDHSASCDCNKGSCDDLCHAISTPEVDQIGNYSFVSVSSANTSLTVEDHLRMNKPDFVEKANQRQEDLMRIHRQRENHEKNLKKVISIGVSSSITKKEISMKQLREIAARHGINLDKNDARMFDSQDMVARTALHCKQLPEVQQKNDARRREEEKKANKLRQELFAKELQEKALRGKLNISHHSSVLDL